MKEKAVIHVMNHIFYLETVNKLLQRFFISFPFYVKRAPSIIREMFLLKGRIVGLTITLQ